MKGIRLFALSVIVLSACTKNNNSSNAGGCNKPATPSISTNSPVNTGSSIQLTSPTIANAAYSWTGPGFSSKEQNPVIQNAVPSMSGTYTLNITVGNCMSDAGSTNITVNPSTSNCSVAANTTSFTGTNVQPTTLSLMAYSLAQGSSYEMTGSDTAGSFGLVAYFSGMPVKDGVYSVTSMTSPGPNEVYITAQNVTLKRNYHSTGGLAYVKVSGSTITLNFCNIGFDDPAYMNDKMTISANITYP
jgi:hypothetical protein